MCIINNHKTSLQLNYLIIAILRNLLNTIHPHLHAQLATSLLEHCDTLVSEFPLYLPPLSYNFPRKNLIISG
ncbi:DNA processing protein DprA, partial [Escherichia coli]